MAGKDNKGQDKNKKGKAVKAGPGLSFAVIMTVILGLISPPAMLLLMVGMLPTLGAFISTSGPGATARALSVTFMNFAGCVPFMLKIIAGGMGFEQGIELIANPLVIVTIYAAAGAGYIIDMFLTGVISGFLFSRGQARLGQIEVRQRDLEERWGPEVSGKIPLDEAGFPLSEPQKSVVQPKNR